jgi:large subunit ribosomal protein L19
MNLVDLVERKYMDREITHFSPGDTVRVNVKIKEGEKFRIQAFEGVVIAIRRNGLSTSFVVRKISFGYGVERIFPMYSPMIDSVDRIRKGRVRRAKLYYLRQRKGKAARIKEDR